MLPEDIEIARMGEMRVRVKTGKIGCHGLGSCIAVFSYDHIKHVGTVTHVVLPTSIGHRSPDQKDGKFMDKAIIQMLNENSLHGGRILSLQFAAVGGANLFRFGLGNGTLDTSVGTRNASALTQEFARRGLKLSGANLGGDQALSTYMCVESGLVYVATKSREFKLLCDLKGVGYVKSAA